MRLAELQHLFWRAVRHDRAPAEIEPEIGSSTELSATARLDIYRRMYWYRQVDALFDGFPILARELGTASFTKLACAFITAHPSEHPALERLGRELPSFVRGRGSAIVGPAANLYADVAQIEWAQTVALLSPDATTPLSGADVDLARLGEARFALAPSVVLCRVSVAAAALVDVTRAKGFASDGEARATVIVWRQRFSVQQRFLAEDEAQALDRLRKGHPFSDVCLAFRAAAEPARRGASCLLHWLGDGLLEPHLLS